MADNSSTTTGSFAQLRSGLNMYYQESGSGETPVLFVPGWTMTSEVFCRQLEFFEESGDYRFITLDPRSHGKTTITPEGNTYEQHGRDLHDFIDALELDNLILCGWSFGTLATLSYVSQFGYSRLSGFIMLDGPPRAAGDDPDNDWATYSYNDTDGSQEFFTMGKLRNPDETNIAFAHWMLEDKNQKAVDWVVSMTEQTPDEIASLLNATAVFLDYRNELIEISDRMPVWCAMRKESHDIVDNWCSQHAQSARLSAYGEHMMFWEQAKRFNSELTEFLDSCVRAGTKKGR